MLAKSPEYIPLLEVIKALEGPVSLVECVEDAGVCPRRERCPTNKLWHRLKEALERELQGLSLKDLLSWTKGDKGN